MKMFLKENCYTINWFLFLFFFFNVAHMQLLEYSFSKFMLNITSSSLVRDTACLSSSFLELTATASSRKSIAFSAGRITNAELN